MAIQFSVLVFLHSGLVLVTTAEDYKCLPLLLRKACCWVNETHAARNAIVFASILINFLGAMINIVGGAASRRQRQRRRSDARPSSSRSSGATPTGPAASGIKPSTSRPPSRTSASARRYFLSPPLGLTLG